MTIAKYIPSEIEAKWQELWTKSGIYNSDLSKPNFHYVLSEFAYPSGDLHMGHWFTFCGADIYARFRAMQGYNVFFPNGFDAFGLPAENAAIKRGIHPQDWTYANIESMKTQMASMGARFSFDHQVITCQPEYYRWNQWIFLKMLERGLAYKGKALSNWCPNDATVLANEQVVEGKCERCGVQVIQKQIEQWFLKITDYADRLIWDSQTVDWPLSIKTGQNNWIGRSEGVLIDFDDLKVFTTRPETIFGTTFIAISPNHLLIDKFTKHHQAQNVKQYIKDSASKSELERKENKQKTGVFTGSHVHNPVSGELVPVWVADYVLSDYGTGAVMGVPAHDERDFEFAKSFKLLIKQVIVPNKSDDQKQVELKSAYTRQGLMIESGQFNGLSSSEARIKIADYLISSGKAKTQIRYHLRDWSISRQRYWGTPIPIIICPDCGDQPVPETDLPVELPYAVDYTPSGEPPLATNKEWVSVNCPKCGKLARRDPQTMDTFFDSSWYFFRYLDPGYHKGPFDPVLADKLMPVAIYFGGAEHTLGHTLYSRFFTKFFKDIGLISFDEYALKRVNHGIILGPDGNKMSKSKGNVVNPDQQVQKYGADCVRVHLGFMMPYQATGSWDPDRVWGSYRFLNRVWNLFDKVSDYLPSENDLRRLNKTIEKVTQDLATIRSNTAIASLMEYLNYLSAKPNVSRHEYRKLLQLLAPFAPHMTEELWSRLGLDYSIHQSQWPEIDQTVRAEKQFNLTIQINGKVRDHLMIDIDILNNEYDILKLVKNSPKIKKFLENGQLNKTVYIPGKILNLVVG